MEVLDTRDNADDEQTYFNKQESMLQQQINHNPSSPPSPPLPTTTSPPSVSSSPTHEFSFTVSLHPHPPSTFTQHHNSHTYDSDNNHDTDTSSSILPSPPLTAIDLSPADDIFFHGHLLPLHLLSPLPVSPRSSTNSMDSFTLPSNLLYDLTDPIGNTSFHCHHQTAFSDFEESNEVATSNRSRPKSKSFSLFSIPKWKKRCDDERERDEDQNRERKNHKKVKLDLSQLIKRYMKMVRPLLSFPKSRRSNTTTFNHQSYSFSGNSLGSMSSKPPQRRGRFSAPASMRTSPANSGIILTSGTVSPAKSTTSESTMEELHAAIQAAIAHCKNSIAIEDKHQSEN